jgi:hypothetical protein
MDPALITTSDLRRRGESTRGLERGVHSGHFVRLRAGVYLPTAEWTAAPADRRHRLLMDAFRASVSYDPVFSHESAALVHGIPVVGDWPPAPHTVEREPDAVSRRARPGVVVHRPLHPVEPTRVGGDRVTGVTDTAIALAASRPLMSGVAALDHVLARGVTHEEIEHIVGLRRPFHGVTRVLRALGIATGLAESPLESISLVPIALADLPRPEQQVEVVARGKLYRLDFFWPQFGVAGEADGRGKYRTPDDIWAEKQRQDVLRSIDISVARWGWDDARAGSPMLERLGEAGIPLTHRFATHAPRIRGDYVANR